MNLESRKRFSTAIPEILTKNGEANSHSDGPLVVELTQSNLEHYAQKSEVPLIMDFYADWCQPCKQLTPMLLKFVDELGGGLRLGKLNIDNVPIVAEQFRVTSIPAVFAIHKGIPIGYFFGLKDEVFLTEFMDLFMRKVHEGKIQEHMSKGDQYLKENKLQEATMEFIELASNKKYRAEPFGHAGLARCAVLEGKHDIAVSLIENIKTRYPSLLTNPDIKKAIISVEVAETEDSGDLQSMLKKVESDPSNLQIRYDLANTYFSKGKHQEAMDQCLAMIKKDKRWNEEAARKLLLKIFDSLGPADPLSKAGRRKFTNLWF